MPTLVFFLLLTLALATVAAVMLIALPRLEGRLLEDPSPPAGPTDLP